MCGLCGILTIDGRNPNKPLINQMNEAQRHRGPDGEGIYTYHDGPIALSLAHRRLSIIDLSPAGLQPMSNEDGKIHLVVNGEIYNFIELRRHLERMGHHFSSQSDAEVIVHLYEEEGPDLVRHLNGMFALALWDERDRTLILARDRVGIKPLVYYWDGSRFQFSSELGSLLQDPTIPRVIDEEALELYLALNYIPAPYTILRNCRKLEPAHMLIIKDGHLNTYRYWDPVKGQEAPREEEEIRERIRNLLSAAISQQMIAHVPLGAFLSGGIDSSIVCALMAQQASHPIKTFTVGYTDLPLFDERAHARLVAERYHTDHHEISLTSRDMIAVVPNVLDHLDEPFADSSAIPLFAISRETRSLVKVALSGDGGDELFAGYRYYRGEGWYQRYQRLHPFIRQRFLEPLVMRLPDSRVSRLGDYSRRAKKFLRGQGEELWSRFLGWNEIFTASERAALLGTKRPSSPPPTEAIFRPLLERAGLDPINRLLYADFSVSLPGDMLWKVDRMSMAHALEIRVPLLDHLLCEFLFSLPGHLKLKGNQAKYIFISTFSDLLPLEIQNKPKWGFEIPISQWLKTSMRYLIDHYLSPAKINHQGVFHPEAVEKMVTDFFSRRTDRAWQIWNLIVFQAWYERYLGH